MRSSLRVFLFLPFLMSLKVHGQTPTIDKLVPDSGAGGEPIKIIGNHFGASQDSNTVTFKGKPAKTTDWTDASIIAVVPSGAESGDVVVTVGGNASDGRAFVVKPPEYDQSSFHLLTGVGAVLAGVESTSYKVDAPNNALSQTNVGRKTIEILLGGGFVLPWHKGGQWIENSFCRTKQKEAAANSGKGCREGGDSEYLNYRPWEAFLSIRFAPASDQTINGFVVGGGYRITKYFSFLGGYSVTPVDEPTHGFRVAASRTVTANPTIFPYNHFSAAELLKTGQGLSTAFRCFCTTQAGRQQPKFFLLAQSSLITAVESILA